MYVYTAQGRMEMFYDGAPNLAAVFDSPQAVRGEAARSEAVRGEAAAQKRGTPCVYVKDKTDAPGKCGKCCQDNNRYWNGKYTNQNNNTYCGCEPITTSAINDYQLVFESKYIDSTKTGISYNESIVSQEACNGRCTGDPTCSFSMFTPQKQCYSSTANHRAGSKVKTPGTIVETKNVPPEIETVFGANYKMPIDSVAANTLFNGKLSYPNCAQRCINTPGCTFAVADHSLSCTLSSLPVQKAILLNDMNAATFIRQ